MQTSLFPYIWQHTRREQIWILAVILISMPFYFMALDLPKSIVNGPIQGRGFETAGATAPFLKFSISLPGLSEPLTLFPGFMIGRETALVALSLLFLALVCINGGFKLYINVYKGRLGERMLRRLRFDLVDRVLRFPGQFRRIKSAEVATMVKDEVEPLGGFIGDAFVQPVFLGGQAITAMAFILTQSFWLGLIAAAIVGVQAFLIPKLRRRLLVLGKERQITARELAGRVGEVVEGIGEIRVNDATNWERADIAHRLGRIFFIRYELYNRKFFVKFLNNFLSQVTPFLFYLIGGWYALRGELDIGQLVAVIAAYKDLPSPIKELIDWDQQRQDVEIKFTQVMEQFSPDQMIPAGLQAASEATPAALARPIEASRLSITDDTGAKLIENVSFSMRPGERIALVGQVNAGGETVSEALARLIWPTSGRLALEGQDILEASEALTGRRLGYVGPSPYFPNQSIRDCLLYGLRNRPLGARTYEGEAARRRELEVAEARASANSELDVAAEWTDYRGAGVEGPEALDRRLVEVLKLVELDEDVYQLGLRSRIDPNGNEAIAGRVLSARHNLRKRLAEPRLARLVEPFDAERYNRLSPIAANLLFGTAVSPAYETDNLPANAHVLGVLEATGLDKTLCEMGMRIAETMIELFGELPENHPFFEQLTFMTAEELPDYRAMMARVAGQPLVAAAAEDRQRLLRLPLHYVEVRHRLGLVDEALEARIVKARQMLHETMPSEQKGLVDFYRADQINAASSLQDNILFGRVAFGIADGPERVRRLIQEVLEELKLEDVVYAGGLSSLAGSGGKRLTHAQRQKIALGRAILKRPDLIIINRGLAALDGKSQAQILASLIGAKERGDAGDAPEAGDASPGVRTREGGPIGLFCVVPSARLALAFDRVLAFENGELVEDGRPEDLKTKGGAFARLLA